MIKSKKAYKLTIVIISIISIISIVIAAVLFSTNLLSMIRFKNEYTEANSRELYLKPARINLANESYKNVQNVCEYEIYNLKFKSPWGEAIDSKKSRINMNYIYKDGRIISVTNNSDQSHLLIDSNLKNKEIVDILTRENGKDCTQSEYDFKKSILNITPNQRILFSSKNEIKSIGILLMLKQMYVPSKTENLYTFSNSKINGIIYSVDDWILIEVYDSKDHFYSIRINGTNIQSDEVRYLISTLESIS
jgi:hypothetical protein